MNPENHPASSQAATAAELAALRERLMRAQKQVGEVIVGKSQAIGHAMACLLAGGHLLIEDIPGMGKTTLSHALARTMGLNFARVQFTVDLMPSDLLGVSIFDRAKEDFVFHPGPIFTQVLLADEINRAGPRTQSALLESMEERQVSIEGQTHRLPSPFFVIATQNPVEQLGTFPLPESQLDRFMMCLSLGYPDHDSERQLLMGTDRRQVLAAMDPVFDAGSLMQAQALVSRIHAGPALLDYLQVLLAATRSGHWFEQGLSPRAGLALLAAARAQAAMAGRAHVSPEDIQAILPQTLAHRLRPVSGSGRGAAAQVAAMMEATPLP